MAFAARWLGAHTARRSAERTERMRLFRARPLSFIARKVFPTSEGAALMDILSARHVRIHASEFFLKRFCVAAR